MDKLHNQDIKFDIAGASYGYDEVMELRHALIGLRDKALGPVQFAPDLAVTLSHTLALLHQMAKFIWGDRRCPKCETADAVTWQDIKQSWLCGEKSKRVMLTAMIPVGTCSKCGYSFRDHIAELIIDAQPGEAIQRLSGQPSADQTRS